MLGRKSLNDTLWLLSSLVLLALVLVAPSRKSGVIGVSSRPDCHRDDLALPQAEPAAYLRPGMADDTILDENALAWEEDEEQDRVDALNEPRTSVFIACSIRKDSARQVIPPRSVLSHYPIRC